jgi:hypothetical protein
VGGVVLGLSSLREDDEAQEQAEVDDDEDANDEDEDDATDGDADWVAVWTHT